MFDDGLTSSKDLGKRFGNSLIGTFHCACGYSVTPNTLEVQQDTFMWEKVNRQDDVKGTMLIPLCIECGEELIYDEAA